MPRRGLMLCHTPRAGSWWLASRMTATGVLGTPGESLHPTWITRAEAADFADYVNRARIAAVSPNGVSALKANFTQIAPFVRAGVFRGEDAFQFVYLTRTDLVLQAISWYRAAETGSWRSDQTGNGQPVVFDAAAIWQRLDTLVDMMRDWEVFFAATGVRPLRLTYEQLEEDMPRVLRSIGGLVDVEIPDGSVIGPGPYDRQGSAENEAWARRLVPSRTTGRDL